MTLLYLGEDAYESKSETKLHSSGIKLFFLLAIHKSHVLLVIIIILYVEF